jgi:gluconolactonase
MKKLIPFLALAFVGASQAESLVSEPVVVGESFGFTEGPAWDNKQHRFVFSDIPNHTLWQVTADGTLSKITDDSGYSNGNVVDNNGNIWSARHDRKLSRMTPSGKVDVVAANFNGAPLNSPNDITVASDGAIWFTDPPFGIQGYGPEKAKEAQPVRGIYRWKDGDLDLMSGDLTLPNGISFNDGSLFVADTADGWVYKFSVSASGLGKPERFARAGDMADGLAFDSDNNLWLATTGGVAVFNPAGEQTCFIKIDASHISNIAVTDSQVLVTAANKVLLYSK